MSESEQNQPACVIRTQADYRGIELIDLNSNDYHPVVSNYQQAMQIANEIAEQKLGDYMLLSWYDRDRDFESPQHASECHADSAVPGYVDYGIYHGAKLRVDFNQGQYVFFYRGFDE